MNVSIKNIANLVGGKFDGDGEIKINNLARIDDAKNGDLTFLYRSDFEKFYKATKSSAIIVKNGFNKTRSDLIHIEVDKPENAFTHILLHYFSPYFPLQGIDTTSFIDKNAQVGENTAIGRNVVISAGCKIGSNVKIFHNTVILENVEIGDNTILFQNVSIRENCTLGKRVIVHPGAVIGSDGFGYYRDEKGINRKVPQIGNVVIEDDVEIGANSAIDRAALGSTIIKKHVKIDNLVQVGHNVFIDENSALSGQAGISGSCRIGKNCILGGKVGMADHTEIGDNVIIAGVSTVTKKLTKPDVYLGYPAKPIKTAKLLEVHVRNLPDYSERIKKLEEEIKILKEKPGV